MTYFVKCQYNSPRLFKIYLHKKYVDICTWSYISLDAPDARVEHSMYVHTIRSTARAFQCTIRVRTFLPKR